MTMASLGACDHQRFCPCWEIEVSPRCQKPPTKTSRKEVQLFLELGRPSRQRDMQLIATPALRIKVVASMSALPGAGDI